MRCIPFQVLDNIYVWSYEGTCDLYLFLAEVVILKKHRNAASRFKKTILVLTLYENLAL